MCVLQQFLVFAQLQDPHPSPPPIQRPAQLRRAVEPSASAPGNPRERGQPPSAVEATSPRATLAPAPAELRASSEPDPASTEPSSGPGPVDLSGAPLFPEVPPPDERSAVAPPLRPPGRQVTTAGFVSADPFSSSPAVAQASDSELAPIVIERRATLSDANREGGRAGRRFRSRQPERRGLTLSTTTGVTSCAAPICSEIAAGGMGRLELGYRFGTVAAFATVSYGGGRIKETGSYPYETESGSLTFLDAGAGVSLYLVPMGIVDPYVGAALGYSRIYRKVGARDPERLKFSRGAFRPTVGVPIAVSDRVRLGPRFDIVIPFAGKLCGNTGYQDMYWGDGCTDISEIVEESSSDSERRWRRRGLPKPWSITLELLAVF